MDIELLAQTGALLSHSPNRDVLNGLEQAANVGLIDHAASRRLGACYRLYWSLRTALRLLDGEGKLETPDAGGLDFLCRSAGFETVEALQDALALAYRDAALIVDQALKWNEET